LRGRSAFNTSRADYSQFGKTCLEKGSFYLSLGRSVLNIAFPGPSSGRNGALRKTILDLELSKRDANLAPLFELEKQSKAKSTWIGLETIAYEIVAHFKPKTVVELGSYGGFSTCALGLALSRAVPGSKLYAVDTWQGDAQTGGYDEDVYQDFLTKRRALGLEDIIVPMRMTFAEARKKIPSEIDLLHIDGWHTFKAVSNDFKMFRPMVARGGIVMFHDVYTVITQMRVFWSIISRLYPSCLIPYSHGLGVIRLP
jgi:predicted O-methyltransferase YrrM